MLNAAKLKNAIEARNMSINMFCANIGISRSAFYRKMRGTSEFTQGEIQKTIDILGLESPVEIFFSSKVS